MAAVTICNEFGAQENKVCHGFLSICHEVMGPVAMVFFFECWTLNQLFHSPLSLLSRNSLVSLCFLPLGWCYLHIWDYWCFSRQSWFQLVLHAAQHFSWDVLKSIITVDLYSSPCISLSCCFMYFWGCVIRCEVMFMIIKSSCSIVPFII